MLSGSNIGMQPYAPTWKESVVLYGHMLKWWMESRQRFANN